LCTLDGFCSLPRVVLAQVPRVMLSLLEMYQQADGGVVLPAPLSHLNHLLTADKAKALKHTAK
jgi:hypothetical protein